MESVALMDDREAGYEAVMSVDDISTAFLRFACMGLCTYHLLRPLKLSG